MLGFFLEAETLILPDSVQKAQWKQIVERFTSLDAETFLLVVNASNTEKDWKHLCKEGEAFGLTPGKELYNASDEIAQLAVQGPLALQLVQQRIRQRAAARRLLPGDVDRPARRSLHRAPEQLFLHPLRQKPRQQQHAASFLRQPH